jgi:ABC-type antimicrobial peptide transport system permease subunit
LGATSDLIKNYHVLKQELLNTGMVKAVSSASSPMTEIWNVWADFSWAGKDPNSNIVFSAIMTGYDYDKTTGLKLKEGSFFSSEFAADSSAVVLNEAAVQTIGFKDPIGQPIKLAHLNLTVIGVIENIVMDDPFHPVLPSAILFNPTWIGDITLRLKPEAELRTALAAIQPIVEKCNPAYPFEYHFVDEEFEKKFTSESQVGKLAGLFAGLAVFISCLGLFGLAAHMAESRTKEIGVRKVLGATATNLWVLLSKDLIVLVLVSCLAASPIAVWFMKGWLEKYQYRIEIEWWVFALAGGIALLIALLTVSAQAIKAALANPAHSLRYE